MSVPRFPPNETPMMPLDGKRRLKRIERHTVEELDAAISKAVDHLDLHNIDFYMVLHGIDAYMERRKRKDEERERAARDEAMRLADLEESSEVMWGDD